MELPDTSHLVKRAHSVAHATALWVFGVATTLVLAGLWGRAAITDPLTLGRAAEAVLESRVVQERISEWLVDGMAGLDDAGDAGTAALVAAVGARPEVDEVRDALIDDVVAAALAPPGSRREVDVAAAVALLVPVVLEEVDRAGLAADPGVLERSLTQAGEVVLDGGTGTWLDGLAVRAQTALTRVMLVGLLGMAIAAAGAIWLSEERSRQVRSLILRLGVSAATFALFLRLGAWAVDPAGGRSPLAAGSAALLSARGEILLAVAMAAAAALGTITVVRRRSSGTDPGLAVPMPAPAPAPTDEPAIAVAAGT
ncbi:MAG TPA: hypothetical protein VGC11_12235 [Acidimicrobiia bacterium]|jgi:hypothetical protein